MNILITFVIIIILLQIVLFVKTSIMILNLKKVLSCQFSTGTTVIEDVTIIKYKTDNSDPVSENIKHAINTYLKKNKGAVSDFNLIKDIVERNCDTLEAEIASQTPLPLYLGLMGTVAGIILGLFTITLSGGFSNIENVIEVLMSDVAIAMIASFMGIGFTTLTLWKSKQCKVVVEANKNEFYTWIQTNLLPVISKSAVTAITMLQQNLTRFNESFVGTIDRLESKLENIGDTYESQIELLNKIEAIDIKKMATANVKVLAALESSMNNLARFSEYMGNVTDYLIEVKDLNNKLDEHLERTETLSVVSDFYRQQMQEIGLRQDAIRTAVISVDDAMKSAFATLQSNSEEGLRSMHEAFVSHIMSIQEMISNQIEQFTSPINKMPQLVSKLEEISNIPSKLDKLIDTIKKSNDDLVKKIDNSNNKTLLISNGSSNQSDEIPVSVISDNVTHSTTSPSHKLGQIIMLAIIAFACIANLIVNIVSLKTNYISSEQFVSETTDMKYNNPSDNPNINSVIPQKGKANTPKGHDDKKHETTIVGEMPELKKDRGNVIN